MKFRSTVSSLPLVDLKTAVLNSFPKDRGLYMPQEIPIFEPSYFENLHTKSFGDIAFDISRSFLSGYFEEATIRGFIDQAYDFDAPLFPLDENHSILELWHGPSLAFKDFGACFMAQVMSGLLEPNKKLTILVATSGDTGGAVASGFYGLSNIEVVVLYPSGKVSLLQEKQITTLGKNIVPIEVDGSFDDCQAMVKTSFLDEDLKSKFELTSANSINIARLIPQSFYYFYAFKQIKDRNRPVVFSVPSGNFGNLMAGLMAQKMGLPVHKFLAATNINDVVPQYLSTGAYVPHPSKSTISNAMDVGNPSNLARIQYLFNDNLEPMRDAIIATSYNDDQTRIAIRELYDEYSYSMDPHGAVAYLATKEYHKEHPDHHVVTLATAHPSKFLPVMKEVIEDWSIIPERLKALEHKEKEAIKVDNDFESFKDWMMSREI